LIYNAFLCNQSCHYGDYRHANTTLTGIDNTPPRRHSRPSPNTMPTDSSQIDADKQPSTTDDTDGRPSVSQPDALPPAESEPQAAACPSSPDRPAAPAQEPKPESTSIRRTATQELEVAVQRVRLDEIDGVEEELQEFIRENDLLLELDLQLDRWAPECLRWSVQRLNLTLWRRKNRLVHLGSGLMLTHARRLVRHEDQITATVIQNKTLQRSQKLLVLGEELLFQAALARTSAMPTPQAAALCVRLEQAGRQMLRRTDARQFALAFGVSQAAVRQIWPMAKPESEEEA